MMKLVMNPSAMAADAEWDTEPLPGAKPCPFCGGGAKGIHTTGFWVVCSNTEVCGAETALANTPGESLVIWNRRS